MKKLYFFELRRLLLNKAFLGLFLLQAAVGHSVLVGSIVPGVACTAPFSGWSYGTYLAELLPFVLAALLLPLSWLCSRKERQAAAILAATPVDPAAYRRIRYTAILTGTALTLLWVVAYSLVFYARTFRYTDFAAFAWPFLVTVLPALVFALGVGACAARVRGSAAFWGIVLAALVSASCLPSAFSLTCAGFYRSQPLSLPIGAAGEPAFALPWYLFLARAGYTAMGLGLLAVGLRAPRARSIR